MFKELSALEEKYKSAGDALKKRMAELIPDGSLWLIEHNCSGATAIVEAGESGVRPYYNRVLYIYSEKGFRKDVHFRHFIRRLD